MLALGVPVSGRAADDLRVVRLDVAGTVVYEGAPFAVVRRTTASRPAWDAGSLGTGNAESVLRH